MKVTIAYIDEPPFGWTKTDGLATGADIDLADEVLRAIGVTRIEHRLTTFSELLPGVEAGRWDMNVPLFVTPERSQMVAFSMPVWAIGDIRTNHRECDRINLAALSAREVIELPQLALIAWTKGRVVVWCSVQSQAQGVRGRHGVS